MDIHVCVFVLKSDRRTTHYIFFGEYKYTLTVYYTHTSDKENVFR